MSLSDDIIYYIVLVYTLHADDNYNYCVIEKGERIKQKSRLG